MSAAVLETPDVAVSSLERSISDFLAARPVLDEALRTHISVVLTATTP